MNKNLYDILGKYFNKDLYAGSLLEEIDANFAQVVIFSSPELQRFINLNF